MGLKAARIGDQGLGKCKGDDCDGIAHDGEDVTGTIIGPGASTVFGNGLQMARISDIIVSNCSHKQVGTIISGSGTVYANGLQVARVGDNFEGCYGLDGKGVIISGSSNVFVGG